MRRVLPSTRPGRLDLPSVPPSTAAAPRGRRPASKRSAALVAGLLLIACGGSGGGGGGGTPAALAFVNYETPPVHAVALGPDGTTLAVTNTPDARLETFDVSSGVPVPTGSVFVGLEPVSVRFRSATEVWVVNQLSDSVSVVDLPTRRVRATLRTLDEPCDVVFAGSPVRAFVSCSQANTILVFDPGNLATPPVRVAVDAEDPRALAVSPDGLKVYAAVFESGNASTVLGGGAQGAPGAALGFPPNVVSNAAGPHGGVNPPPNGAGVFVPAVNPGNPAAPAVALIVKRDAGGAWRDDTGADWTSFVSGPQASLSGRAPGWDLPDRDVVVLDTATLGVSYVPGLMNLCMDLAVQPTTGRLAVVGTDATNEVRFEPVLEGRFLRVLVSLGDPAVPAGFGRVDLNPHLTYAVPSVAQAQRDLSLGDPRGAVWSADGTRLYVTGMGSGNLLALDATGQRVATPLPLGAGPAGLAVDAARSRLYVWNRFEGSVSVVDTAAWAEVARVPTFDPTPAVVRTGRRHLYDTHATSGLGHVACASCHADARMDRLAWDLGDPSGTVKPFDQNCISALVTACEGFHPMKGPMATQTLLDIVGHEPFHWRGDRDGLEEFALAFANLQGDDDALGPVEMQELEDFLATVTVPPNPFRPLDNSLPTQLPLPGHFTTGRFAPAGQPLPDGNAAHGLTLYRTANLDAGVAGFQCVTCHTLPTGTGPDFTLSLFGASPIPPGPLGERHHGVVSVDGSTNVSMKIPQLRNLYDKVGCDFTQTSNRAGVGFLHDGSVDSLARFVTEPVFNVTSDQDVADLVAFLLAFSGSDLPQGSTATPLEAPGTPGKDSHAAVGVQVTLASSASDATLDLLGLLASSGAIDLVARGRVSGVPRGFAFDRATGVWRSDRDGETFTDAALKALAAPGAELTFTAVARGLGPRLGRDRDGDGFGDLTEADAGTSPADASSHP